MSDLTPEDVDGLFQEGSEGHQFEYNETAWGQMENLLDRRDRRRLIWKIIGVTISLLLLVSAYVVWGDTNSGQELGTSVLELNTVNKLTPLKEEKKESSKKITPKSENQTTNTNKKDSKTTPIAKVQQQIKEEKVNFTENNNTKVKTKDKNKIIGKELVKYKRSELPNSNNHIGSLDIPQIIRNQATEQKIAIITTTGDLKISELSTNTKSSKATTKELENNFSNKKKPFSATQTALTTDLATLPSLSMEINYKTTPIDFPKSLLEDLDKVQRTTIVSKLTSPNQFVVGVLLSKEFSFVDMNDMTNLKWKAGLSVEYRFGEKHGLKLGVNYSQKDYMTSTIEDYQVEDGFWPKATAPNTASAICDVLEFSVTESYFMNGHDKKGFFVNGGLTSYLLLKERYNYTYDTNDPELLWSWGENNTNRHWFGIGEISVGYNLPFTDNSSLQIAPYAQIPLTGVGHGALKLFSSGILIRYNFHLK